VSARALQKQRQNRRAEQRRRIQRSTLGWVMAALVLLASGGLLADRLMDPTAFPIRELTFEGEFEHLDPDELRARVTEAVDANYFAIDLKTVERAAESLDWVEQARVRRVWPDGLHIGVEEHRLVARWGTDAWLNDEGDVVKLAAIEQPQMLRLDGPQGTADEVFGRARRWAGALQEAGLRLKALTLNERRAWYAVVARAHSGAVFSVALGRDSVTERFERFVKAFPALPADKAARVDHVDARYPNGIALRLQESLESEEPA